MNGEVLLLFQLAVAHHLLTQVTHLDIQGALVEQSGECLEHLTKQLVARILLVVIIDALAQYAAMNQQEWWEDKRAVAHDTQQMAHHSSLVVGDHHHIRLLAGSLSANLKESAAVEEVGFIQLRQVFKFAVYGRRQLVHTAKIVKKNHKLHRINRD